MHWNQIEYAKGEAVEVWWHNAWYRGTIVGVHVQPGQSVRYYVAQSVWLPASAEADISEYAASQIRRAQQ